MKLAKLQEEAIQLVAWADERPAEQVLAFVIEQGLTFAYGSVNCTDMMRAHTACADSLADEVAAERTKTFGQSKPTKE